jgi:phage-related baseplate assembly protein
VLYPSQIENLEMHTLAYRESLLRSDIQRCAEQNLVEYATGEFLDAWGANYKTPRLKPAPAECRVQFVLDEPIQAGRIIPAGTRVITADNKLAFETVDTCYILSNQTESNEIGAVCTTAGVVGNGLALGVLCEIDPAIKGMSVTNTSITEGGTELEGDERYRERLVMSPAAMGCGGTAKAYRYWAMTASNDVSDALAVNEPDGERGDILIYVLAQDGEPSATALDKVTRRCNSDDVRLIGDVIRAVPAIPLDYQIRAEITVFDSHDPEAVIDRVKVLAYDYTRKQMAKLGYDITPTQILLALSPMTAGLYHVNLLEPCEIITVGDNEWPRVTQIDITLTGVARG